MPDRRTGRWIVVLLAGVLSWSVFGQVLDEPGRAADDQPAVLTGDQPPTSGRIGGKLKPKQPTTDEIRLDAFAEAVELKTLIEYVAETLQINVSVDPDLSGSVVFNAPVTVAKGELLALLDALLEQHNYTITQDKTGWYNVQRVSSVGLGLAENQATTRIIRTPNVRPSSLQQAIQVQLGGQQRLAYIDDLGVIVVTDTPRRAQAVADLVERILAEREPIGFMRFELRYIAASTARSRAMELLGGQARSNTPTARSSIPSRGGEPSRTLPSLGGSMTNLGERLTVDAQGNALIFRGLDSEIEEIQRILAVIDLPNTLSPKRYFAGAGAMQIAAIARDRGLGEITSIDALGNSSQPTRSNRPGSIPQTQPTVTSGGPTMVVDEARGLIIYYGTEEQHKQLAALVEELDTGSEIVVVRVYKLEHAEAGNVADLILGLLDNMTPQSDQPPDLLPGSRRPASQPRQTNPNRPRTPGEGQGIENELSIVGGEDVFVLADEANNQILVKAPLKQQPEFAKLITRLDLRRPQVYIEAKIIAVTWTDDFRLAFETQLINANGRGGVLNTNFGLKSFASGSAITDAALVSTGLGGLTAAVIKNDYVPIVLHALETEVDGRILSSPQILVDDNEEATIESNELQPTTTTTTGQTTDRTSFGGFESAGTILTVTPHISEGGYMRLKYNVELSNFLGTGSNGIPPPKAERKMTSESVTIPSDTTIIVGGITLDEVTKTVSKLPLLGDIPGIGALFRDNNRNKKKTTLYVFITPRIMREPNFDDLALLTRGPQAEIGLDPDIPELEPARMKIIAQPADEGEPGMIHRRDHE